MKILGRVFFVVVTLLLLLSLLPTLGIAHHEECTWKHDAKATRTSFMKASNLNGLSISVRSNENEIGKQLREHITAGLTARGVSGFVDNPVAKRRLTMTLEEMSGRWNPFYSSATLRTRTFVDLDDQKDRAPHSADVTVTVEGSCMGLVKKDGWLDAAVERVATATVTDLFDKE